MAKLVGGDIRAPSRRSSSSGARPSTQGDTDGLSTREGPSRRRGAHAPQAAELREGGEPARGGLHAPHRRGAEERDRRAARAPRQRRVPRRPPPRGLRRGPRGVPPYARPPPLRRPDHGRRGPPPRQHRRDEDGRGQDPGRHPAGLPQRHRIARRARHHGQRLPRQLPERAHGPRVPRPRHDHGRDPRGPDPAAAPRAVRRRHHVRHEQRVRLRLPARQHGVAGVRHGPARPLLRRGGRGRLHPHRRGPHAAHHLGPVRGRCEPLVHGVRDRGQAPRPRGRLRGRREEAHGRRP